MIGFDSELFESGLPEEQEQWAWLEDLPQRLLGRPAIVFTHKPIHARTPQSQDPRLSVGPEALPRLTAVLDRLDVRALGSGHLHHFQLEERDGTPVVSAPSTAFIHRGPQIAQIAGPGLNQLGVVEYAIEEGVVRPRFRAPADLVEPEFLEVEDARRALDAMGVVLPA